MLVIQGNEDEQSQFSQENTDHQDDVLEAGVRLSLSPPCRMIKRVRVTYKD